MATGRDRQLARDGAVNVLGYGAIDLMTVQPALTRRVSVGARGIVIGLADRGGAVRPIDLFIATIAPAIGARLAAPGSP